MNGEKVPKTDHICRYCKGTSLINGQPSGMSFLPRLGEESLSVNWLEKNGGARLLEQLASVRQKINITLKQSARFAVLNVGATIDYVGENVSDRELSVLHEPTHLDDSHCGIHGYNHEDDLIADLIAEKVLEVHSAVA